MLAPVRNIQEVERVLNFDLNSTNKKIARVAVTFIVFVEGYFENIKYITHWIDDVLDTKGDPMDYRNFKGLDFHNLGEFYNQIRVDFEEMAESLVAKMQKDFEEHLNDVAVDNYRDGELLDD